MPLVKPELWSHHAANENSWPKKRQNNKNQHKQKEQKVPKAKEKNKYRCPNMLSVSLSYWYLLGPMIFRIHVYIDTSPRIYFRFRFRNSEGN